jgi:hypothetical protein
MPPLGPSSFHHLARPRQEAWRPRRARRCLLKGCERSFTPSHPQSRYCSEACRRAARAWRCWQASQRYRATPHGKDRRRAQQCRYRQRCRERQAEANRPPPADTLPPREGQRPALPDESFSTRPCDRPGCYEVFVITAPLAQRRFCSSLCRLALRRVLEREARYRQRRRRWRRERRTRRWQRPDTS